MFVYIDIESLFYFGGLSLCENGWIYFCLDFYNIGMMKIGSIIRLLWDRIWQIIMNIYYMFFVVFYILCELYFDIKGIEFYLR